MCVSADNGVSRAGMEEAAVSVGCEDPRPHAWTTSSEFPTESPTHAGVTIARDPTGAATNEVNGSNSSAFGADTSLPTGVGAATSDSFDRSAFGVAVGAGAATHDVNGSSSSALATSGAATLEQPQLFVARPEVATPPALSPAALSTLLMLDLQDLDA